MTHKFLFIVDPLAKLNTKTDTTLALMQEACSRSIDCYACEIGDLFIRNGQLHFLCAPIFLKANYQDSPRYLAEKGAICVDDFAVVFMRKDPPVDKLFWSSLLMLRCYDPAKSLMINNPDGLLVANEKLFGQAVASDFYPATLVSAHGPSIDEFVAEQGRVVLKPLFGAGGSGVLVVDRDDLNLRSAVELLSNNFSEPIMVQAYIKNARQGDKRILLLGGEPLGAVLRVPKGSDHRANFHAGGKAVATDITEQEEAIIKHLKPFLLEFGLHFVGIDVIDGFLTEINVTSPTCLLEMEQFGRPGLRGRVIDYIQEKVRALGQDLSKA